MIETFTIRVNGAEQRVPCDPERSLLDLLREELRLTGTKRGCGIGACGSCTILVDGKARRACQVRMKEFRHETRDARRETNIPPHPDPLPVGEREKSFLSGSSVPSPLRGEGQGEGWFSPESRASRPPEITTIEGLERDSRLHPLQEAFIDCGAIQCGFCTPGMILQATALLADNPSPSREEIRQALAGNLCRCTGYQQIFEAIEEGARRMKEGKG